jgi:hypothetical protein
MMTRRQNKIYRPLVKRAWLRYCLENDLDETDRPTHETWYRKQLLDAVRVWTTKQLKTEAEHDAVLLHFAILAGDQAMINRVSGSEERRALWRLRSTAKKAGVTDAYIAGIQRKMGYDGRALEHLPAEIVLKINTAVYLYMLRQQRKEATADVY